LNPPQIGVGAKIILNSSTTHASKVFATPKATFVKILVQLEYVVRTNTQFIGSVEPIEGTRTNAIEKTIEQPIKVVRTID
jgi:hypothetical protein